jgi:hypothetical protein
MRHCFMKLSILLDLVILNVLTFSPAFGGEEAGQTAAAPSSTTDDASDQRQWRVEKKCGVNTLYLMLRLTSRPADYAAVERCVPVRSEGTTLLDMSRSAAAFGLELAVIKGTPATLRGGGLPVIAHLEEEVGTGGHYVVVTAANEDAIEVIDGTSGKLRVIPESEFNKAWSRYLLIVDAPRRWGWSLPALIALGGLTVALAFATERRRVRYQYEARSGGSLP